MSIAGVVDLEIPSMMNLFAEAATDVVTQRVQSELRKLLDYVHLRLHANHVSRASIDDFELSRIQLQIQEVAPFLVRTLCGFVSSDPKAKQDAPTFVATISSMLLFHHSQN